MFYPLVLNKGMVYRGPGMASTRFRHPQRTIKGSWRSGNRADFGGFEG